MGEKMDGRNYECMDAHLGLASPVKYPDILRQHHNSERGNQGTPGRETAHIKFI